MCSDSINGNDEPLTVFASMAGVANVEKPSSSTSVLSMTACVYLKRATKSSDLPAIHDSESRFTLTWVAKLAAPSTSASLR